MTAGASRAAPMIAPQPALAPSPQPRPAPTARALPPGLVEQGGQNWMPIEGQIWTPIDSHGEIVDFAGAEHRDLLKYQDVGRYHQIRGTLGPCETLEGGAR